MVFTIAVQNATHQMAFLSVLNLHELHIIKPPIHFSQSSTPLSEKHIHDQSSFFESGNNIALSLNNTHLPVPLRVWSFDIDLTGWKSIFTSGIPIHTFETRPTARRSAEVILLIRRP